MRRVAKSAASLSAVAALSLSGLVATEVPASAASCNITFKSYSTVSKGSRGSKAKAAECLLRRAGYAARVNGSFSSTDARKAKAFQRSRGIRQTGKVDRRTWTALLSRGSKPYLKIGKSGASVKRIQRALTASGRSVPVTGYYGPMTSSAVKSVERAYGWKADGKAGSGVWRALQSGGAASKVAKKKATRKKSKPKSRTSSSAQGKRVVAFAKAQLGDSYRFGATGPNAWDCSGLTGGAWKSVGVKLPRTSQSQFRAGKRVSKSNLRRGDLVFFYSGISHVAIYAGNGNVIQASRPGRPVNKMPMKYMPYAGARRPA